MKSFNALERDVNREHFHIANRLKSISADACKTSELIELLHSELSEKVHCQDAETAKTASMSFLQKTQLNTQFCTSSSKCVKVYCNLRCGVWYAPRFDDCVYFKSSDGHYGRWNFSLTRLNLQLLQTAAPTISIIVDGTQHGKRFPDSMSITIPMWAQVLNHALLEETEAIPSMREAFPPWVSDNEVNSIEQAVPSFVEAFRRTAVANTTKLPGGPIKCSYVAANDVHARDQIMEFVKKVHNCASPVHHILLLGASGDSDNAALQARKGWYYVRGAGDDHQSWSMGLEPSMLWKHVEHLTDPTASLDEIEARVRLIVDHYNQKGLSGEPGARQQFSKKGKGYYWMNPKLFEKNSNDNAAAPIPIGNFPFILAESMSAARAIAAEDPTRTRYVLVNLSRSSSTPPSTCGDAAQDSCGIRKSPISETSDNSLSPSCALSTPEKLKRLHVKEIELEADPTSKHGIERHIHQVVQAVAAFYHEGEQDEGSDVVVIFVTSDYSFAIVFAIALILLFFPSSCGSGSAPLEPRSPPEGESNERDTSKSPVLNVERAEVQRRIADATVSRTMMTSGKAHEDDIVSSSSNSDLSAHSDSWICDSPLKPTPQLSIAKLIETAQVSKERIRHAQQIALSHTGSIYPSRSHMKQLNRYFLTPANFGRNSY